MYVSLYSVQSWSKYYPHSPLVPTVSRFISYEIVLWFVVITGNPGQVIGLNQKDSTKMYMSIRDEAGIDPEVMISRG